jgi:hypothetical protein
LLVVPGWLLQAQPEALALALLLVWPALGRHLSLRLGLRSVHQTLPRALGAEQQEHQQQWSVEQRSSRHQALSQAGQVVVML